MLHPTSLSTPATSYCYPSNSMTSSLTSYQHLTASQNSSSIAGCVYPGGGLLATGFLPAPVYDGDSYNVTPMQFPWQRLQSEQLQQQFPCMTSYQQSADALRYQNIGVQYPSSYCDVAANMLSFGPKRLFVSPPLPGPSASMTPLAASTSVKTESALENVEVSLANKELWQKFDAVGTEMIITKAGRRMFPSLKINIKGLQPEAKYFIIVDVIPADDCRYKFHGTNGCWTVTGRAEPHIYGRNYIHQEAPATGTHWMKQAISLHKLKLTNNTMDQSGHIILNSMHKYLPRVHVIRADDVTTMWRTNDVRTFTFPSTTFITVTAYQNEMITKLKIDHNPFAKGFRETSCLYGSSRDCGSSVSMKRPADDESDTSGQLCLYNDVRVPGLSTSKAARLSIDDDVTTRRCLTTSQSQSANTRTSRFHDNRQCPPLLDESRGGWQPSALNTWQPCQRQSTTCFSSQQDSCQYRQPPSLSTHQHNVELTSLNHNIAPLDRLMTSERPSSVTTITSLNATSNILGYDKLMGQYSVNMTR